MKIQFIIGYILVALLALWSLISGNLEFVAYSVVTGLLLAIIHFTDRFYSYSDFSLWGFNIWMLLHILGGLYKVNGEVLYSFVLVDIIAAPYSILKYDQLVHAYCYFIVALLIWQIVSKTASKQANFIPLALVTVLAATGVGGLNEIIEFLATVFIENVNVGGYENTAIDIVCNLIGAMLAVPLFKKFSKRNSDQDINVYV